MENIQKPLKGNDDSCEDGAAEGDVVEGVDDLRQEVGIDRALLSYGPHPHFNKLVINLDCNIHDTSNEGVVKNYKDDEDTIKDGQSSKEVVEGVLHMMSRQNKDGEKVTNKAKHAINWLKI